MVILVLIGLMSGNVTQIGPFKDINTCNKAIVTLKPQIHSDLTPTKFVCVKNGL